MKVGQLLMDWYKDLKKTFENLNTFFRMMVHIQIPLILELFEKVYVIWEKDVEDIPAKFRELTRKRGQKRRPSKEKEENRITELKEKLKEKREITPQQKYRLSRELMSLETTKKTCEKQKKKGSRIPCDERKKSVRMPYTKKTRDIIQTSITWLNEVTYFLWEIESELGINCKTSFQDDIFKTFSKFEALTYITFKKID